MSYDFLKNIFFLTLVFTNSTFCVQDEVFFYNDPEDDIFEYESDTEGLSQGYESDDSDCIKDSYITLLRDHCHNSQEGSEPQEHDENEASLEKVEANVLAEDINSSPETSQKQVCVGTCCHEIYYSEMYGGLPTELANTITYELSDADQEKNTLRVVALEAHKEPEEGGHKEDFNGAHFASECIQQLVDIGEVIIDEAAEETSPVLKDLNQEPYVPEQDASNVVVPNSNLRFFRYNRVSHRIILDPHAMTESDMLAGHIIAQDFFQLNLDFYTWSTDSVFVTDSCTVSKKFPIANFLFADEIRIEDIYLGARIAFQGKLIPTSGSGFGTTPAEQYIACSSQTRVIFDAFFKETEAVLRSSYQFRVANSRLKAIVSAALPIKHREHMLSLCFSDGFIFCTHPQSLMGETNLTQFFGDYISFEDYFKNCVLDPKKLTFKPLQVETGIADIYLTGAFDLTDYLDACPSLEVGLTGVIPTGKKTAERYVCEIELGNGGIPQLIPYVDMRFYSNASYINPRIYTEAILSFPFNGIRRVPKLKNNNSQDLLLPPRYQQFIVLPFSEFDSLIRGFADAPVVTRISCATALHMQLSNYWYNLLQTDFSLGMFYDFYYKGRDKIKVNCCDTESAAYNEQLLEEITPLEKHMISWNLWWNHGPATLFEIGSQHTLKGSNAYIKHCFYASINISY